MVCSHIHAEPLRERFKGLNELGVKTPINDITEALDKSHYCVSLFIDPSKAFDTVDFSLLKLD